MNTTRPRWIVLVLLVTLPMLAPRTAHPVAAAAPPLYRIVDLGTLGGTYSAAAGINNRGQVVGEAGLPGDVVNHAFLWDQGAMHDLGTLPGGAYSQAAAINDRGQVTGNSDASAATAPDNNVCNNPAPCHAVLWSGGAIQDLGTLGGLNSLANDLNARGEVVGLAEPADTTPFGPCGAWCRPRHPTLWYQGTVTVLPSLGGPTANPRGINDAGVIVGRSDLSATIDPLFNKPDADVALWAHGAVQDLGTLPGGKFASAYAVNNRTQVVGTSYIAGNLLRHAFLWQDGRMTDLGTLPGDQQSLALGINARGQVVGGSFAQAFGDLPERAALWQDGVIVDLTTRIVDNPGWQLLEADAINDGGQIVGAGFNPQGGAPHAYLLTPLPGGPALGQNGAVTRARTTASALILPARARALLKSNQTP